MTTNLPDHARTKDFDLVLFGASGFTGSLVAEYLVKKRASLRWALAGRSREKLERVRDDLAALEPAAKDLPLLTGDSLDPAAMAAIVRRARVIGTTVGPYCRYGGPLVAACAEQGVHYCDITGETPWIRAMIDAHHERAAASGARIVHCCGFDSIPSDLGVLMLHDHLARSGKRLATAHYRVVTVEGAPNGSLSGGSAASMLAIAERAGDPAVRRVLADPYALNPKDAPRGPDRRDQVGPRRDPDTGRWTAPFLMAPVNTRIVRRSNALLDFAYGRDFRYDEAVDTGPGARGLALASALSAAMAAFMGSTIFPATRRLLARVLPAPGEGPSREQRERGSFRVEIRATSADGEPITGVIEGTSDPGYGETAKMFAEAALCLATDDLPPRGGVLTPASCLGMALIARLRAAGMTFRVETARSLQG